MLTIYIHSISSLDREFMSTYTVKIHREGCVPHSICFLNKNLLGILNNKPIVLSWSTVPDTVPPRVNFEHGLHWELNGEPVFVVFVCLRATVWKPLPALLSSDPVYFPLHPETWPGKDQFLSPSLHPLASEILVERIIVVFHALLQAVGTHLK